MDSLLSNLLIFIIWLDGLLLNQIQMRNPEEYIFTQQSYSPKRISLKQHQCIRRRWSLKQIFSGIGLVLIILWAILFSNDDQNRLALTNNQAIELDYLSQRYNDQYRNKFAQNYLNNFCRDKKCQRNDTEMILSFIQLLSQQQAQIHKIAFQGTIDQNSVFPAVRQHKNSIQVNNCFNCDKKIDWQQLINFYSRHSLKEVQLFAVKRLKLTTPKHKNNQLVDLFWSIFGFQDQYSDIDRLFDGGDIIWQVNMPFSSITIASHSQMQLQMLEIDFLTDKLQNVAIFGLSINLRKEIFKVVSLGSYSLSNGLNRIHCSIEDCKQRYSMIRLVFSNARIRRIRLYQLQEL